jgi:hypothetical protein
MSVKEILSVQYSAAIFFHPCFSSFTVRWLCWQNFPESCGIWSRIDLKLCEAVGLPPTVHKALNRLQVMASLEDQTAPTNTIKLIKWWRFLVLCSSALYYVTNLVTAINCVPVPAKHCNSSVYLLVPQTTQNVRQLMSSHQLLQH